MVYGLLVLGLPHAPDKTTFPVLFAVLSFIEAAEAGSGPGSWPLGGASSRDARRRAKKVRAFLRAGA